MRAVLLDALGTLLRLQSPWRSLRSRLASICIDITPEQAKHAFAAEIAYYVAHHLEGTDEDALADLRTRCAATLHSELPVAIREAVPREQLAPMMLDCLRFSVYPEVEGVLEGLRAHSQKLIVVSNWDVSLHQLLGTTGLAGLIDGVVTSAEVGQPKPSPVIFERALELAGVPADQAIHVGDSLTNDVGGALAAGVAPVLLCRTAGREEPVPSEARMIYSLTELLA
jgi:HAD superfamily hydrolase (TIGR01509 family)